jgi:glycosyltransferase involved in cell wall biosynthesis
VSRCCGRGAVHQVVGVYADRDAVGGHTAALQHALRRRGLASEIFAGEILGMPAQTVHPVATLDGHVLPGRTVLVYQASAYSPVADLVADRHEPLVLNYHNVTPARYFSVWEPSVASDLARARLQIRSLADRAVLAISDSSYNDRELRHMGYDQRIVAPVLIDAARIEARGLSPWPETPGTRWLFVGRLAPNKAQHHVVRAFAFYRRVFDHHAVLALPGRSSSHLYQQAIDRFISSLGLDDVVIRPGSVPDDVLSGWYRDADVFVCLSDHEGFCNTVIEAMAADVPVVAYASTALPETIGDAGLLLGDKSPARVATAVHRVVSDSAVRDALVSRGRIRRGQLSIASAGERIAEILIDVLRSTSESSTPR